MTDKIRIGVIGAHAESGWARAAHLPALAALPDYEITAVAATSETAAREAARRWGAAHAFTDAGALIAHPDVDVVTIAVQLPRRDGLAEAVIEAGKHVYCEWPLAIDAVTAARFRDRADKAGVRHAVGLQTRHHPAIRRLRELIAAGSIGQVLSASMTYSLSTPEVWSQRYAALFDRTKGVNHLAVVAGHSIDMFRSAVGDFTELSATLTTRITGITLQETGEDITVTSPDQIAVTGLLASGAAASVHFMTGGPRGAGFRIEIHGRSGRLALVSSDDSLVAPRFTLFIDQDGDGPTALPVPDPGPLPTAAHNVQQVYAALAEGIRTGTPVEPSFDTALETHRILDAVEQAAETGRRQHLR